MTPQEYDAWYDSSRGQWIGLLEYAQARKMLALPVGSTLLDAGCGTGWFTRRFAADGYVMAGADLDQGMLAVARQRDAASGYLLADSTGLPFRDGEFDGVISIAVLNFISAPKQALAEIVRVTRHRFVIGVLNRSSLLYLAKGVEGGSGGYAGSIWYTRHQLLSLFDGLPVQGVRTGSVISFPSAGRVARCGERFVPRGLPFGSMLFVCGEITRTQAG